MSTRSPDAWRPRSHLLGLDGLRGIAALAVLADHTAQHLGGPTAGWGGVVLEIGAQGLTVFFVLSGFLIYRPFAVALIDGRRLQPWRPYIRNRLLRIVPAYWVVFVVAALLVGVVYRYGDQQFHPDASNIGRMTDPVTILANLLLVQSYFPGTMLTGIAPAWSLTTELTFYLVLPLLAAGAAVLAARGLRPRAAAFAPPALLIVVGGVMVTGITISQSGMSRAALQHSAWGSTGTAVLDRSLLAQGFLFGLGMLVACCVELRRRSDRPSLERHVRVALLVIAAGFLAEGAIADVTGTAMFGVGAAVLLLCVLVPDSRGRASWSAQLLESPPLWAAGLISYSVYLWHLPVINWLTVHHLGRAGPSGLLPDLALVLAITLPLATATYLLVERPALRLKGRRRAPIPVPAPAVAETAVAETAASR